MPVQYGMVASVHPWASKAGLEILKQGGNAIDAAVATSAMMGVVAPQYSGLGGGGFILIHLDQIDKTVSIDCREVAPKKADSYLFRKVNGIESSHSLGSGEVVGYANRIGYKAIGVPGNLAGLSAALEKYGTMNLKKLLKPAINIAKIGYPVSRRLSEIIAKNVDDSLTKLKMFPATGRIYLRRNGTYKPNEIIVNKDLGKTLKKISGQGTEVYYKGEIARKITNDIQKHGGLITQEDLEDYDPVFRKPLSGEYKGYTIFTMSPPGGGATVIEILNILEEFHINRYQKNSEKIIHLISEAMKQAFNDKKKFIADPDFNSINIDKLLSKKYAKRIAGKIDIDVISRVKGQGLQDRGDTVHFSVIDSDKNIVSMTESIECYFGSGVTPEGTGFILNDQMHDFNPISGDINSIEPGKRPSSYMAPTLVMRDGAPFLTLGSAGGSRIISSIVEVIVNMIDFGMNIREAVFAPRFHPHEGEINISSDIPEKSQMGLQKMGYKVRVRDINKDEWWYFGAVHAINYNSKSRNVYGAAEPLRDGVAIGN